jgi:transposase
MRSKRPTSSQLEPINMNAAGIDIGSQTHWVCVPAERALENIRSFGSFTADLYALADWLQECQIETLAMESTGVYWIAIKCQAPRGVATVKLTDSHVKTAELMELRLTAVAAWS